jgi:hypothetical protein
MKQGLLVTIFGLALAATAIAATSAPRINGPTAQVTPLPTPSGMASMMPEPSPKASSSGMP